MSEVCPTHGGATVRGSQFACCWAEQFDDDEAKPTDYQRNRPDVDVTAKANRCLDAMRGAK